MDNISIRTTQNIDIDYEVASIGDRIGAALLDVLIHVAYFFAYFIFYLITKWDFLFSTTMVVLINLPIIFYHLVFEIYYNGQSFGKRILKIKVIRVDGSEPTLGNYAMRWLFRLIDVLVFTPMVAIITILFNGKGQRLGDLAATTTVVKIKPRISLEDTIYAVLENNYEIVFPQVAMLTDEDLTLVKEVLNARHTFKERNVVYNLYLKLKKVLNVETNMKPIEFLNTVVKDYNAINS